MRLLEVRLCLSMTLVEMGIMVGVEDKPYMVGAAETSPHLDSHKTLVCHGPFPSDVFPRGSRVNVSASKTSRTQFLVVAAGKLPRRERPDSFGSLALLLRCLGHHGGGAFFLCRHAELFL